MSSISIYLILGALILLAGLIAFGFGKLWSSEKKKNAELQSALNNAKKTLAIMTQYTDALNDISKEDKEIAHKIAEAETDEEIKNVISDIIAINNSKLRDK